MRRATLSGRLEVMGPRSPTHSDIFPVAIMLNSPKPLVLRNRSMSVDGATLYKDHPTQEILVNIQLGIRHSLKQFPEGHSLPPLGPGEFSNVVTTYFPKDGSSITPKHTTPDFHFKEFAPKVFARIRQFAQVDPNEYQDSITRHLEEISTPGKSGALFYKSRDEQYLIKTVTKMEARRLMRMLPAYYQHITDNRVTLLPRFLQMFRITTAKGRRIRMLAMFNILPATYNFSERFDLKGSRVGRESPRLRNRDESNKQADSLRMLTMKDLDYVYLGRRIELNKNTKQWLMEQVNRDTALLQHLNLMDYSLLLGIRELSTDGPPVDASSIFSAVVLEGQNEHGKPVQVFAGMIDILSGYTLTKKTETAYKTLRFGSGIASAVSPSKYATRLKSFLGANVFA
eukprot:c13594_g1_i1.p1 GENE.c13594_g1_i1~~c13594_g1_i1.p1  ORF type:complete len:412 (+),score=83.11 c13594_g1_i1:40-1236(+)